MTAYEIPPIGTDGRTLLGWLLEAVSEGEAWLGAQRPSTEWDDILRMMGPDHPGTQIAGLSNTGYDLVTRNAREIVASLSNFRHEGEYKPRWDKALYDRAHTLTKLDRNRYVETHAYDAYRSNIQNGITFGTGYVKEVWYKAPLATHGEIISTALAPSNVTFVQLPADHDLQRAYMVIEKEELTLGEAQYRYQGMAGQIVPDRDSPGWLQKGLRAVQKFMGGSPALRVAGTSAQNKTGSFPTVDVFTAYVLDHSVNSGPLPVTMGTQGTNWEYTVPVLGSALPTGLTNPATGQEWTRPAEPDDCRLFPLRRMCIFTRTAVIYDGSSPWWHGHVPIARVRFNDWPWEALGRSLLGDVKTMQDGIIALMRYIEDTCAARLDLPYLYDEALASEGFSKTFDPRMAGSRAAANLQAGDIIKFPIPYQVYDVPTGIYEWIKSQEERINKQMGVADLVAMAKARQVPSSDSIEKFLEMAGPLVQDMIRAQEIPHHQLGILRLAYYFQFYTRGRVIQEVGRDGELQSGDGEQFTPDQLVPSQLGEGPKRKQERARQDIQNFKYSITQSGMNEMHRLSQKLMLMNLKKVIPIDRWTMADAFQIPNYGPKPEGTHNVMERVMAEAHMDRELAEEIGGGQAGAAGRPPTNRKAPQQVQKDHGTRTTVKTS